VNLSSVSGVTMNLASASFSSFARFARASMRV
jgi:hypothetical protein